MPARAPCRASGIAWPSVSAARRSPEMVRQALSPRTAANSWVLSPEPLGKHPRRRKCLQDLRSAPAFGGDQRRAHCRLQRKLLPADGSRKSGNDRNQLEPFGEVRRGLEIGRPRQRPLPGLQPPRRRPAQPDRRACSAARRSPARPRRFRGTRLRAPRRSFAWICCRRLFSRLW